MGSKDWVTSETLIRLLSERRNNDVKIWMHGDAVPVKDVYYDPNVDAIVLVPDRESKDYRIATSFCPENVDLQ